MRLFLFAGRVLAGTSSSRLPDSAQDHHHEHGDHSQLDVQSHGPFSGRQGAGVLFHAQRPGEICRRDEGVSRRNFIGKYRRELP